MKKGITIIAAIALIAFLGFAFTSKKEAVKSDKSGIEFFNGTWQEALTLAKKENKLIFLDAYAAWCGPCKMMANSIFVKQEAGNFYNKNFINYKMDMEKHKDGPRLARKYGLTAYPTLYIVNTNEEIAKASVGYLDLQKLLHFGKSAIQ